MEDQYGSDFITIVDEDGKEYELEVLSTLEYNGETYMAVIPADAGEEGAELSLDTATTGMAAPFHEGAARYYREHGITVKTTEED